jgi:ketosteroid isomerase-like protein
MTMNKYILAVGAACLAMPVIAIAEPILNAPADVAAVKAFEQANAEQLDVNKLADTYAADAVVLDYMIGGLYQGRAAIKEGMSKQLAAIKSVKATIREHNIVTDGNFACDMQTTDYEVVTKDGSPASLSLRQMDVIQRIGGKWQIVQQHVAALKDNKTGNAVMKDLAVRGDQNWPQDMTFGEPLPVDQAKQEITKWTHDSIMVVGIDAIMPYYGPGEGEMVQYVPTAPGNIRGKSEMYAYYAPSMNSFTGLETKLPVLKIDTDGVIGAQIDIQDINMHLKGGKEQKLYWRQSDCLHRVGSKWYGVLTMSSFPVDMATGKMDGKWEGFPAGDEKR